MKKITATLAAFAFALSLAACGSTDEEYDANIDTGVVVSNDGKRKITVLEDDREKDSYKVSKSVVKKCTVGKRWPDCKK